MGKEGKKFLIIGSPQRASSREIIADYWGPIIGIFFRIRGITGISWAGREGPNLGGKKGVNHIS